MWTLEEGLVLCRLLQPMLRPIGYHLTLGGGVLNTGKSKKDLDLFLLPLKSTDSNPTMVFSVLEPIFGNGASVGKGEYDSDSWKAAWYYFVGDKRIDVFIQ